MMQSPTPPSTEGHQPRIKLKISLPSSAPSPTASAAVVGKPSPNNYPSPPVYAPEYPPADLALLGELPDLVSQDLPPLAEVVDAVVRDVFIRLGELGEVLPGLHESVRAREVFQFAAWARRQVVKLLAVVRWSSESQGVEKCMNIITFLDAQNAQFDLGVEELTAVRQGLTQTRLRNPDLLTALSVLSTGTYERLPRRFQTDFEVEPKLTDRKLLDVLHELNGVLEYRLRAKEVVPMQMASYRIADGRAYFTAPNLFRAAFSLTGAQPADEDDSEDVRQWKAASGREGGLWYLVDVEFLFGVGGRSELEDVGSDFPRRPTKDTFNAIADVANRLLAPLPLPDPPLPATGTTGTAGATAGEGSDDRPAVSGTPVTAAAAASIEPVQTFAESPAEILDVVRCKLAIDGVNADNNATVKPAETVVDAPLVRVFNLLQSLSLTYQLEILFQQAQRIRALGWANTFDLAMAKDRKSFKISYWRRMRPMARPSNQPTSGPAPPASFIFGGTLTVSLTETSPSAAATPESSSSTLNRVLNEIEGRVKTSSPFSSFSNVAPTPKSRVSDRVLETSIEVVWESDRAWSEGIDLSEHGVSSSKESLVFDPASLDLEGLLYRALEKHSRALLHALHKRLLVNPRVALAFDIAAGDVALALEEKTDVGGGSGGVVRVRMHGEQWSAVAVDVRSGRVTLREEGEMVRTGEEAQRMVGADRAINAQLRDLDEILVRLKFAVVADSLEQKLLYLGLNVTRRLPFKSEQLYKLGPHHNHLFVSLPGFPDRFFVVLLSGAVVRYALISVRHTIVTGMRWTEIEQVGWLDEARIIRGGGGEAMLSSSSSSALGLKRKWDGTPSSMATLKTTAGMTGKKGRFHVEVDDLRELHAYALARVAVHKIEEQLKRKRIPFSLVSPTEPSAAATVSASITSTLNLLDDMLQQQSSTASAAAKGKDRAFPFSPTMTATPDSLTIPCISVSARDLLRAVPAAVEIAHQNVRLRIRGWWEGRCEVVASVKLRRQPTLATRGGSGGDHAVGAGAGAGAREGQRVAEENKNNAGAIASGGMSYDAVSSVVSFATEDIEGCVEALKREFGRVGKIAIIANEINRLKDPGLQMTYFDLQTVTFLYAPGLVCSIGWKPEVAGSHSPGSYDVSFGVVDSDPAAPGPTENPHTRMTSLFRELLNTSDQGGSLLDAIQLLRSTLPLIQATLTLEAPTAPVSINLWQRSISCFCFIYEAPRHRVGLVYTLALSSPSTSPKYLIQDAATVLAPMSPMPPPPGLSHHQLLPPLAAAPADRRVRFEPIPGGCAALFDRARDAVRRSAVGGGSSAMEIDEGRGAGRVDEGESEEERQGMAAELPPVMSLGEEGLLCEAGFIGQVLATLNREIVAALSSPGKKEEMEAE